MNEKLRDELAVEHENACYRIEPWKEVTHAESFKAGWNACHDEDMKTIAALKEKLRIAESTLNRYAINSVENRPRLEKAHLYEKEFPMNSAQWRQRSMSDYENGWLARETLAEIKGAE